MRPVPQKASVKSPVGDARPAATTSLEPVDVSIVIKTLNEEENIAHTIHSALAAIAGVRGEVIVADSLSSDATVDIAGSYPVTVVQLRYPEDRCCGAGPQLGFQHASGEFVYILDGDMELDVNFLGKAMRFLRTHPDVAGVAGIVEELGGGNYEFERRKSQNAEWSRAGFQRWLDMGGLYRRAALLEVGYFSNRNLHACEEQDLGLRLGQLGYRLVRLPIPSVRHHGRREASWELMKRRFTTRYSDGPGELLRATFGSAIAWQVVASHIKLVAMATLWLVAAIGSILFPWNPWPLLGASATFLSLVLMMLIRKRSVHDASLGMMNWILRTAGFVRGLFSKQVSPRAHLANKTISTPGIGNQNQNAHAAKFGVTRDGN